MQTGRGVEGVRAGQQQQPSVKVPHGLIVGLLAMVLPLSVVAAGTSVLPGDVETTQFVQTHLPGQLDPLITIANLLGSAPGMIAIATVVAIGLVLRGHRRSSLMVAAAMLAQGANFLLKLTLESPRPESSLVQVSEQASGFGFPSGHVMGTTVLALVLFHVVSMLMAAGIGRRLVQTGLLLVPVVMGVARVETGAHWPTDVLGAWLWGTLATIAIVTTCQRPLNGLPIPVIRRSRSTQLPVVMSDLRRGTSQ